jgi:hypothetical protein
MSSEPNMCSLSPGLVLGSLFRLSLETWWCPARWHRRMQCVGLPRFLDELEAEIVSAPPRGISPGAVIRLVKLRTKLTWRWRNNRCLLNGLLLWYLLPRAGWPVTLHVGCKHENGSIRGHCWITSPELTWAEDQAPPTDLQELVTRSLAPRNPMRPVPAAVSPP